MSAASMAALIVANLKAIDPAISGALEAKLLARWTAICQGIIDEVVAAAVVSVSGVTHIGGVDS